MISVLSSCNDDSTEKKLLGQINYHDFSLLDERKQATVEYKELYKYGEKEFNKLFSPLLFGEEENNIVLIGFSGEEFHVLYLNKETKIKKMIEIDANLYMKIEKEARRKKREKVLN